MTTRDLRNIHTTVGTHFHVWHSTKTTPVFLPADGEANWSLLPSLAKPLGHYYDRSGLRKAKNEALVPL